MLSRHRSAVGLIPLFVLAAACSAAPGAMSVADANEDASASAQALSAVRPMIAPVVPKLQGNWIELNGGLVSDPVITSLGSIYYEVMATGPDGNIYAYYNDGLGNPWSGWVSLGNAGTPISAPPAVVVYENYIDVFAFDPTLGLISKHGTLNGPYAPTFPTPWLHQSASGMPVNNGKPPVVVLSQPNNQENIFAILNGGSMGIMRTGLGLLGNWTSLSGVFNTNVAPAAVSWGADRLDVFGLAAGNVYHRYSNDNGNTFYPANNNWESLGGTSGVSSPAVASWGVNRFDLFELTSNGSAEHLAWTGSNYGSWCGGTYCWDSVPGTGWSDALHGSATPAAVATGVGAVNVFFQGTNHELFEAGMATQETATSSAKWTADDGLASCFRTGGTPSVISANGTNIEIAVTGYDPTGDTNLWVNSTSSGDVGTPNANNIPTCSCGAAGEPCCDNSACAASSYVTCGAATQMCDACGAAGESACPAGAPSACQAWTQANSAGTCVACGGPSQAPCASTSLDSGCQQGFTVVGAECVSCGQVSEHACNGTTCAQWAQPDANGICQPCGIGSGTACRTGTACQNSGWGADPDGSGDCACIPRVLAGSYTVADTYNSAFGGITGIAITATMNGDRCDDIAGPVSLGLSPIDYSGASIPLMTIGSSLPAGGATFTPAEYSQGEIPAGTYAVYIETIGTPSYYEFPERLTVTSKSATN